MFTVTLEGNTIVFIPNKAIEDACASFCPSRTLYVTIRGVEYVNNDELEGGNEDFNYEVYDSL